MLASSSPPAAPPPPAPPPAPPLPLSLSLSLSFALSFDDLPFFVLPLSAAICFSIGDISSSDEVSSLAAALALALALALGVVTGVQTEEDDPPMSDIVKRLFPVLWLNVAAE